MLVCIVLRCVATIAYLYIQIIMIMLVLQMQKGVCNIQERISAWAPLNEV